MEGLWYPTSFQPEHLAIKIFFWYLQLYQLISVPQSSKIMNMMFGFLCASGSHSACFINHSGSPSFQSAQLLSLSSYWMCSVNFNLLVNYLLTKIYSTTKEVPLEKQTRHTRSKNFSIDLMISKVPVKNIHYYVSSRTVLLFTHTCCIYVPLPLLSTVKDIFFKIAC